MKWIIIGGALWAAWYYVGYGDWGYAAICAVGAVATWIDCKLSP